MAARKKISFNQLRLKAIKASKKGETAKAKKLFRILVRHLESNNRGRVSLVRAQVQTLEIEIFGVLQKEGDCASNESRNPSLKQGYDYFTNGSFEEAARVSEDILKNKPNSVDAYNLLGAAQTRLMLLKEAINSFQQATILNPDHAESFLNLGSVLEKAGRYDEAEIACGKAIKLKPDFVEAYCILGHCMKSTGRNKDAVNAYQQSLSMKPEYAPSLIGLSHAYLKMGLSVDGLKLKRRVEGVISFGPNGSMRILEKPQ